MEDIEKIIVSTTSRIIHDTPSKKTLELINGLAGSLDVITKSISSHNIQHEADMQRILPVLEAFEFSERRLADARASGKFILYMAGFVTAVGGAWLILTNVIRSIKF